MVYIIITFTPQIKQIYEDTYVSHVYLFSRMQLNVDQSTYIQMYHRKIIHIKNAQQFGCSSLMAVYGTA